MTGIVIGSTMGNTENAAGIIAAKLGDESKIINVSDLKEDSLNDCDRVLLGSSTWGIGDLQDDWEMKINLLGKLDLSGKKIGFFGCGDQEGYADSFADALGTLYEAVKDSGAEIVGQWPVEGYTFDESKAVVDGKFVGLPLDEDNQSTMTESRISEWVKTL
eukprot:Anaeramoba_ignava/a614910_14.p1 GENE.a614910_14~~a614910_14.p1  ORF type:complete len:161 (+),score=27.64 a614910_14:1044-1526(+)